MSKERLSRLQKWILKTCYERNFLNKYIVREFFGKRFHPGKRKLRIADYPSPFDSDENKRKYFNYSNKTLCNGTIVKNGCFTRKEELISTRSIEVTITRTLRNLVQKELLKRENGNFTLTKKAFLMLTKIHNVKIVSFKEYAKKIEKLKQESEQRFKKMVGDMRGILGKDNKKGCIAIKS